MKRIVLLCMFCVALAPYCFSQKSVANNPHKKCWLKGKWLLVSTVVENQPHDIDSAQYKGFLTFKSRHRYQEEAFYEGYHWIITGKWNVAKHSATIVITDRHYILGKLEDKPGDIKYELGELTKTKWTASSTAKGQPVNVSYKNVNRKRHNPKRQSKGTGCPTYR